MRKIKYETIFVCGSFFTIREVIRETKSQVIVNSYYTCRFRNTTF